MFTSIRTYLAVKEFTTNIYRHRPTSKLNNTTGRLYHVFDLVSPTMNKNGRYMSSALHLGIVAEETRQETKFHSFQWYKNLHQPLAYSSTLLEY